MLAIFAIAIATRNVDQLCWLRRCQRFGQRLPAAEDETRYLPSRSIDQSDGVRRRVSRHLDVPRDAVQDRLGIFDVLSAELAVIYHNGTGATESCRDELVSPHHDRTP
jgi:hypothetical protein